MSFRYEDNPDEPIDLSCFDDEFERAETRFGDAPADPVPDGYYEVRVEEARLKRTPRTGNPMLVWKLRILGPQCRNSAITKTRIITAKTLGFVKEDLRILGIQLQRFSQLEDKLPEMNEKVVNVYKKASKEGWSDVYFTRPRAAAAEAGADAANGPDYERLFPSAINDDLPF